MTDTVEQVGKMIKARYPIIGIATHEEGRVLDHLVEVARAQSKAVYVWSISQGLLPEHPESVWTMAPDEAQIARDEGARYTDPVAVLRHILESWEPTPEQPQGAPVLYVLKDLHPYMAGSDGRPGDPVVLRLLRDLAAALVNRHQTIILLSPHIPQVPDLQKDVVVLDFPLPTAQELDEQLTTFVDNLGVDCDLNGNRQEVIQALRGLTVVEADCILAQAVVTLGHLGEDAIPLILAAKREIIQQSGALEFYERQATYEDIGGLDNLKAWCQASEAANSPEAQRFGVEPNRGVLLVGVPGCGKSLSAKAIAGGKRPLLRLDMGAVFGSLVGQSEAQIRQALRIAEAVSPCVLWIDEIEKALGSGGGELDGGTSLRVLGTLLTWMEETTAPVFVAATANDITKLRPELVRRFDEQFFVDVPNVHERAEILTIHLRKRNRDPEKFDLAPVVQATENFTGAELEKVVRAAIRDAFVNGREDITTDDLARTAQGMIPLVHNMREQVARMREWASRAVPASSPITGQARVASKKRAIEI